MSKPRLNEVALDIFNYWYLFINSKNILMARTHFLHTILELLLQCSKSLHWTLNSHVNH